jgi:MoaA/NifB/PqqE/SkfB family radical SAM enzyme
LGSDRPAIVWYAVVMTDGRVPAVRGFVRDARFGAGLFLRRPFQVLVQVTNRCNMRCSFCDFWPNPAPRQEELTADDYWRLSAQLAEQGCFMVSIEGGEPLVRPDITEIVAAFGEVHLPVLFTNGWFVDEPMARALWAAGLHQVAVSIDFPEPARQDAKRGLQGGFARAVRALEILRDTAPLGGNQVQVMTVLLRENQEDLERLLELSAGLGVGHAMTLLSTHGYRRGTTDALPDAPLSDRLLALWRKHPHLRAFRDYLEGMDPFLTQKEMPRCRAGLQSFNVDHVGAVAACIEKIDRPAGNVKYEPLADILARLRARDDSLGCQDCWTLCRGFGQALGGGGSVRSLLDLTRRVRS